MVDFVIFGLVVAESRFVYQLLLSSFSFNDNEVCVESLLEKMSTEEVNVCDSGGRTVVHAAAFNDSVESLHLLLKRGVEVSIADSSGQTPLMVAAKYGHTAIIGEEKGAGEKSLCVCVCVCVLKIVRQITRLDVL